MYHEERVILGVLCWRSSPDGTWTEYTGEQLTERLMRWYNSDGSFQIMHNPATVVTLRIEAAKKLEATND